MVSHFLFFVCIFIVSVKKLSFLKRNRYGGEFAIRQIDTPVMSMPWLASYTME